MSISNNTPKLQTLLDKVNALPEAGAAESVLYISQTLTEAQQLQARTNIDSAKSTIVQVSDTEPTDAETEIWINTSEDWNDNIADTTVLYTAQTLTNEQKTQARENIGALAKKQGSANAGKILVVGADGNLALADMPTGTDGDVIGMIDENNNIVITGDLAEGTYVFKYENADGTYADIGSLVVGNSEPSYTNLADPTASGWVNDSRIGSSGVDKGEGACAGAVVTNFIHVPDNSKIIYIKGLDIVSKLPDGNVAAFSRYSSADLSSYIALCYSGTYSARTTVSGDVSAFDPSTNVLNGEYIRMTGTLLDGYTAEDVIITLGEPIE